MARAQCLHTGTVGPRQRRHLRADTIRERCVQEFCTKPMMLTQFLRVTKGRPYRLIPRQSSGKQRVIDDAARGGQSERSQDTNKLVLCTPFRPAQHVALVARVTPQAEWAAIVSEDEWQRAGEDWPDAYRQSPILPDEALGCVVCFWHHKWDAPAFHVYSSLLFGLPLAVTSFNRYSKLVEAMGRRYLRTLVSMYFDDAHITDRKSSGPSSQWAFTQMNTILGTSFAIDKKQIFTPQGTFLGLDFDFSTMQTTFLGSQSDCLQNKLPSSTASSTLWKVACSGESAVEAFVQSKIANTAENSPSPLPYDPVLS